MIKAQTKENITPAEAEIPGRTAGLHDLSPEAKQWRAENAKAAKAWVEWVKTNGLPLEQYRQP